MADSKDARVAEIRREFGEGVEDDLASELVKLCTMYNISAENLKYTWESLYISFNNRSQSTIRVVGKADISGLQDHLQRKVAQESSVSKAKKIDTTRKNPMNMLRNGLMKSGGGSIPFFGAARIKTEPAVEPTFSRGTEKRKGQFAGARSDVTFALEDPSSSSRGYRYMYEKVSERSETLDDRIEEMAQLVKDHYNISEFGDPSATTEEDVVVVGRVTLDSDSSSVGPVKLNEASLALESSRAMGSGIKTPFKFEPTVKIRGGSSSVGGAGFFPGAIVALKGKNGGGGWFMVSEILSLPVPSRHVKPDAESSQAAFSMSIACGPYTADADLKFRPWEAFLSKLKQDMPDVVLLVGPFLDAAHPHIRQGEVDDPPDVLLRKVIVAPLQEYLDSKEGCLVVVVPSVRDLVSEHTVFPQAQFSETLFNDPRIRYVPNPSRFTLNGVSFAVSSVDVLFHLRKEEFYKRAPPADADTEMVDTPSAPDPMANLCRHLIEQRSYYPIFPVPQDLSHEVNLDVTHSEHLKLCNDRAEQLPDVLISPSRLKQFGKNVDGIMFVNPSFLTKGTYAALKYAGGAAKDTTNALHVEISKFV